MKKFAILSILLFVFSLQNNYANTNETLGEISGTVIDQNTQEALAFVTVAILNAEQKILTGALSDENGYFSIPKLKNGNYTLEVQYIGYKTFKKPFIIAKGNTRIALGSIPLEEDVQQMEEVVVRAETSTIVQKVDRKVINVGKDLTATGASAIDLMNNIPSVNVDNQTGNISLRGNANVRVLVDGKPTNISTDQLLQQIPSSSIKSIELITNPSAKYNPEGMSGIINIVLNKNANTGFNGTLNTGVTHGRNTRFNGSLDLNYKVNKVNFFANYGTSLGKRTTYGNLDRLDTNSLQDFTIGNDPKNHLFKVGMDYYINDKSTLSFYTTQNINDDVNTFNTFINNQGNSDEDSQQLSTTLEDGHSQAYNVNYSLDFNKEGHNLDVEYNYNRNKEQENVDYLTTFTPSNTILNRIDSSDDIRSTNLINVDYTNPLNENSTLELGVEARLRKTENDFQSDAVDNNDFNYDRDIYSVYANYKRNWDKFSVQAGLRAENYNVVAKNFGTEIFKDDYITAYPSAFVTYSPSDKNQFQLSYSRRVDRPNLGQVNPSPEWNTANTTSQGNPALDPQFTNSLETNYTRKLKKGSVTMGVFYRRVNDNIGRTILEDPLDPNRFIFTYDNLGNSDAYGIEIASNYRVNAWWSLNGSIDMFSQVLEGFIGLTNKKVTNTTWNGRVSNSFKANKKLTFQLTALYRGANKGLQFDSRDMFKLDAGVRWSVLDGKGTISANVNDIFDTFYASFDAADPYPQTGEFNWESQTAFLGFNYRFGGGKNKAKRRKRRDSNESRSGGGLF